jgi:4-nitrophenyl phosphatase
VGIIDQYAGFLIDLDGVVLLGDDFLPGAVEALAELAERELPHAFVTNNPRLSPGEHAGLLRSGGVLVEDDQVITSASALVGLTKSEFGSGIPVVATGTPSFLSQLGEAGFEVVPLEDWPRAEAVLVSGHEDFTYAEIRAAALAARAGAPLLATGRDPTMPMPGGPWPGTGAMLAAIETASGVEGRVTGKPEPAIFEAALEVIGSPDPVAMIGDRLDTDIAGAGKLGLDGILVGSGDGESTGASDPAPRHRVASLANILD